MSDVQSAPRYPECEKLQFFSERSSVLEEFLEWLTGEYGIVLGRHRDGFERPFPVSESTDRLLAAYFGIDLAEVERERRDMLARQRQANQERDQRADQNPEVAR